MKHSRWLAFAGAVTLITVPALAETQASATAAAVPQPPASTAGASANDAGSGVEDIVVTAQRRSERLQDVPIAVTATSAVRLAAVGVVTAQELAIVTPGLSAPQTAGYAQPHIRGVGSSTAGAGLEQPVATYIDGVYIAAAAESLLTLNNIDRVEVLKGPQGTLFGRNATGGLVQIITRDPQQQLGGTVDLTYGNYNKVVADAYVTAGLTSDLAADLALRYEHQGDGWGRNLATGNPTGDLPHDFAGRMKFLFGPDAETQVRLSLDYEDRESRRETQHLGRQYPGTFNNVVFGGPFPLGSSYDVNTDRDQFNALSGGGAALQIKHGFGGVSLQSITAYRKSTFSFLLDTDQVPRPILNVPATSKGEQFSEELQLSSSGSGRLKWVAGLFYFNASDRWAPFDVVFGVSPISPVSGVPVTIQERDRQRTDSLAGYGQATYEVLPATNLTVGGRYTYERKREDGLTDFIVAGTVASTTPVPPPPLPAEISFRRVNYRVALDHKFGRDILGYLSYNTGFKSGGYNLAVPDNQPYQPESIGAAEAGIKTQLFDRHLRLNAAAFTYNYKNIQVGRFVGGTEAIYNGARARIRGVDLDGELVLARGLSLTGGFAYLDARFTSFPGADFIVPIPGFPPNLGAVTPGDARGKRLPFAPETTFNVGGDYKIDVGFGSLALDVTFFRSASFFAAPDNVGYQGAYDLINGSIMLTDARNRASLKLWAKNIGRTTYATSLVEANQGLVYSVGAPRTYGLTLGYKF